MAYQIKVKRRAIKSLQKIPEPYYTNIRNAMYNLASDPRPRGCKKLKGRNAYRIRVLDYRVIYTINDNILQVFVVNIGHRKDIY